MGKRSRPTRRLDSSIASRSLSHYSTKSKLKRVRSVISLPTGVSRATNLTNRTNSGRTHTSSSTTRQTIKSITTQWSTISRRNILEEKCSQSQTKTKVNSARTRTYSRASRQRRDLSHLRCLRRLQLLETSSLC